MKIKMPKIHIPKSVSHSLTKGFETLETGALKASKDAETLVMAPTNLLTSLTSGKANKLLIPLLIGGAVVLYVVVNKK